MLKDPILFIGGTGIIGGWTAKFLRESYPEIPLLIGGRDLAKAKQVASDIGNAAGVAVDLKLGDLGFEERSISAVAVFLKDDTIAGLRFAQTRGVPHIGISSGLHEIAPEVAAYVHQPNSAPVVLGGEWLVGATTIHTLEFAKAFHRVEEIRLVAVVDELDVGGPAAAIDVKRLSTTMTAALTRRDGAYIWRADEDAKSKIQAVDGSEMRADALAPFDVVGLANATGAPNVRFDLATGVSSSRRKGGLMSTEIIIEMAGFDHLGKPLRTRHGVVHPQGQMPVTGLGISMVLERLTGLDGQTPTLPGLYLPYQLIDHSAYLTRFEQSGGSIVELDLT